MPCFGWLVQHLVVLAASGKLSEGSGLGPVDAIAWLFALQIAIEATCDVMVRLVSEAHDNGCAVHHLRATLLVSCKL